MPTPSLILVPARFKTGKLYTPVATTSGGLVLGASGDFNVTRATTATRVNASGFIESVASGIPRLDYYTSGGTAGCPALLVEPSGSNAFIQSQTLFTSHLVLNLTTAGYENAAVSPDGTQNAEKFVPNATNGNHGILDATSQTITSGTTYTFSCFAKSDGGTNFPFIALQLDSTAAWGATKNAIFNVVSGTIHGSAPSGVTMRIENYGNGWYRFSATATAVGSVTGTFQYRILVPNSSAALPYAAASGNTEGVLVWGAQLEVGSIATSYIPTTTGSVTRNADVISLSGAVSGCIGQTEGTIYWEGDASLVSGAQDILFINRNNTNSVVLFKGATNLLTARVHASGGTALTIADTVVRTGFLKLAVAYKSGDSTFYINGTRVGTLNTTAFTFTAALNTIRFGDDAFLLGRGDQRCRAVAPYSTRLTDSELAALTTL